MRGGCVLAGVVALLVAATPALAQDNPVADKGDQFAPKETGKVEKLRFWYGPYAVPPGNDYNRDYRAETDDGTQQLPMLNVFRRDGASIRHFWGSELMYAEAEPGQDPRHCDTIDPQWNLFDFCLEGRGTDWYPALTY